MVTSIGTKVDEYLIRLSGFGYSGATLLAKDGNIILRKGYGVANDSTGTRVTASTVFDIGSLTKVFTATAVFLLAERKRLSLDDSITKYLDSVPSDKRGITIRQLLGHKSGMDSDFPFTNEISEYYEEGVSRDEAVRRILAMSLINRPGTKWSYANVGYVLLAAIVEHASGESYRDYLRTNLFEPAGMRSSGFWGSDLPPVPDERLARSYNENGETANLRKRSATTWIDQGGGEMVSTVDDLYAWLQALRAGRIISQASLDMMWSADSAGHTLGWDMDTNTGLRRIHHGGDYVGFGAELAYYPDDRLVLVNLVNRQNDVLTSRYAADRVIPQIVAGHKLEMWPGEAFDSPPAWSPTLTPRLRGAVGTYRLPGGGELVVNAVGDDALSIAARGQDAIDLLAPAADSVLQERRKLSEATLTIIEAAGRGDTTVAAPYMREGVSAAGYTRAAGSMFNSKTGGKLLRFELVGTAPSAFPRRSNNTLVRFVYERGQDILRLKWLRGQHIYQVGGGKNLLAATLLRASATSDGLVGWHINWARTIRVTPQGRGSRITSLAFTRDGAQPVVARRVAER